MTDRPQRVLLGDETGQNQVGAFAFDQNWILRTVHAADPATQTFELVYETPSRKTTIHYIENHQLGMNYLSLKGENVPEVVAGIERKLKCRSVTKVLDRARAAKSFQERVRTLYEVALTAPAEPEPERYQLVEQTLRDPDAQLRHAALLAIAYIGWPQFRPLLEEIAKTDTDETNCKDAALLAGRLASI